MTAAERRLEDLADDLLLSEERTRQLSADKRRLFVDHSLTLHRDSASADDIEAMLAHLRAAGMPGTATLKVDGPSNHTRMHARWKTETESDGG